MEPDQRHVDLIVQELGLLDARPVSTPGEAEAKGDEEQNAELLSPAEATKFRALAARANYPSAEKPTLCSPPRRYAGIWPPRRSGLTRNSDASAGTWQVMPEWPHGTSGKAASPRSLGTVTQTRLDAELQASRPVEVS